MTTLALFDSIEMDCNGLAFYLLSKYLNLLLEGVLNCEVGPSSCLVYFQIQSR